MLELLKLRSEARRLGASADSGWGYANLGEGGQYFAMTRKFKGRLFYYCVTPNTALQEEMKRSATGMGFAVDEVPRDKVYMYPNGKGWAALFIGHIDRPGIEYVNLNGQSVSS